MAKIVRIRLYRVQDYDLYALYYDKKNFHLSKMFLAAVSAYANGRPLPVFSLKNVSSLPKPVKSDDGQVIRGSGVKFTLIMSFSVPEYDTKTIALIECLMKENVANSFLKTLVRRCFTDMEYMYLDEKERKLFPDPGSMVINRSIPSYTNEEKKKPHKKRKPKPQQVHNPFEHSNERYTANHSSEVPEERNAYDNRQEEIPKSTPEQTPNQPKDSGHADSSNFGDDLFSLVHGFEV